MLHSKHTHNILVWFIGQKKNRKHTHHLATLKIESWLPFDRQNKKMMLCLVSSFQLSFVVSSIFLCVMFFFLILFCYSKLKDIVLVLWNSFSCHFRWLQTLRLFNIIIFCLLLFDCSLSLMLFDCLVFFFFWTFVLRPPCVTLKKKTFNRKTRVKLEIRFDD